MPRYYADLPEQTDHFVLTSASGNNNKMKND